MVDKREFDDDIRDNRTVAPVLDLVGEKDRLLAEKKVKRETDLKKRFQKAMGWDKKEKKTKRKKKGKNKKKR